MRFNYITIPAALFVLNWGATALAAPVVDFTAVPQNNTNNQPAKRAPLPPTRFPGSAEEDFKKFRRAFDSSLTGAMQPDSADNSDDHSTYDYEERSRIVPPSMPFIGSDSTIPVRRSKVLPPAAPFVGSDPTVPVRKNKIPPSAPFVGSDPTIPGRRRQSDNTPPAPSLPVPNALATPQSQDEGHQGMNMQPPTPRAQPSPAPTTPVGPSPEADVPEDLKSKDGKQMKRFIKNADYQNQNGGSTPPAASEAQPQPQPQPQGQSQPEGEAKA